MKASESTPLSRRTALKILGTTAAVAGLGLHRLSAAPVASAPLGWELPPLPFAYDALEPSIDARTMEIHHSKHHQGYVNNTRRLLQDQPALLALGPVGVLCDLEAVPAALRGGVRNNVGGHVNHSLFWPLLAPAPAATAPRLTAAIAATFGSADTFKEQFTAAALKRFGSGWAWLSAGPNGKLMVHSTANQDSPLSEGFVPLIGLDVWEHAYYLHYQNRRADYVTAFWSVLNWTQAEANYTAAVPA